MKIAASASPSHLLVRVELENSEAEPIYAKHWLKDWYGLLGIPEMDANKNSKTAGFTRELAYACTGGPGELVLLSGNGPSFPPHISPTRPRRPWSSRLLPGAKDSWTIRLPLPIHEWHAYTIPGDVPTRPIQVQGIRYRLEWIRESECLDRPVKEFVNFPGVFQALGLAETHEAVAALPSPITVLQRTDAFKRFG